jgi:uncharacterized protein (TIGR02145 family)
MMRKLSTLALLAAMLLASCGQHGFFEFETSSSSDYGLSSSFQPQVSSSSLELSSSSSRPQVSSSSLRSSSSSSQLQVSSSSLRLSSSSSQRVVTCSGEEYDTATKYCSSGKLRDYGYVQDDEDNIYKTVVIGDQTWMAENLNYYKVPGSKCYEGRYSNCDKYGRLYDWATAMGFPQKCNSILSYTDADCVIPIKTPRQGICPSGWHLPSNAEWNQLYHHADNTANTSSNYDSPTAGMYLKAQEGWDYNGNGEDTYGFAALPGGWNGSSGIVSGGNAGLYGFWWSSNEFHRTAAYNREIDHRNASAIYDTDSKTSHYSVRCIKDYELSIARNCTAMDNTATRYCSNGEMKDYGSVQDDEGNAYKTVAIGEQTWMAENLNYNVSGSKCYAEGISGVSADSVAKNCEKYGRLYDWATAMGEVKDICPNGWHIPSNAEWDQLYRYIDSDNSTDAVGKYLKAAGTGWDGDDDFGFAALPGGLGRSDGAFINYILDGHWWSSSERYLSSSESYSRTMSYVNESASSNYLDKNFLLSVRCIQD